LKNVIILQLNVKVNRILGRCEHLMLIHNYTEISSILKLRIGIILNLHKLKLHDQLIFRAGIRRKNELNGNII